MSCHPTPQPQASGMAAIRASSGTTTKVPIRNRSNGVFGSGSISGRGVRVITSGAGPGPAVVLSVVAVIMVLARRRGRGPGLADAYVTVTYPTVGCASDPARFHLAVGMPTPSVCQPSHYP